MDPKFDKQAFGERVRQARKRRRWTQTELGERVGRGLSTVTDWETGKRAPEDPETLLALADALGVSLDYLLGAGTGWRERVRDALMDVLAELDAESPAPQSHDAEPDAGQDLSADVPDQRNGR